MADLTLTYGDRVITTLDDAGKVILKTCGKYCAKDIVVEYAGGGGGEEPTLPDEYQQVEYLGVSDGNQYCQISAPISAKDNVEVVVMDTASTTSEQGFIGVSNNTSDWELFFQYGVIKTYGNISMSDTSYQKNTKYRIIGVLKDYTFEPTFYFGRYRLDRYPFTGKLYELRIYISRFQKDYVWCHLIPCYRKSDSVPGFYDLISRVFYTNAGSGSFIVGPSVSLGTRLAPIHIDVPHGYVSNGTWTYEANNVNCYSDIYSVEAGKLYKIELGATVSNRFRVMFSTTDVSEATSNVSGIAIINRSNPSAYVYECFEAPQNGYITIQKTNATVSNIPTFVYEVERT